MPYQPHEPFAGAWQQNVQCAKDCAPSLLAFPAVYACVTIIASDVAKLPLVIKEDLPDGGAVNAVRSPYWRLLHNPNPMQTRLEFIQHYMSSKLIAGNTYVLLLRDERGVVNQMYVLDPHKVMPLVADETGDVFYSLGQDRLRAVEDQVIVPARDIIHDKMVTLWHPLVGVSPLFAAAVSAMTGARIMINSERFFANMSRASGILTAPGKISEPLAARVKEQWEQNYGNGNIGRTAVMGEGMEYKPLSMNAVDAQLVEQLRWSSEDVARVYRVPGFMLGDLTKLSYRNSEQMARTYYQGCLQYHLESVELILEKALGISSNQHVEFGLEDLFRMEIDTRYKAYDTALKAGFLSINDVRRKEGESPVKGGDEPMVQMQYVPLSVAVENAKVALENAQNPPEPVVPVSEPDEEDNEEDEDNDEEGQEELDFDSRLVVAKLLARVRGAHDERQH